MISKETRNILILTLLTAVIWILIEIYHINNKSNVQPNYRSNLTPISAEIDRDTLQNLRERMDIENQ